MRRTGLWLALALGCLECATAAVPARNENPRAPVVETPPAPPTVESAPEGPSAIDANAAERLAREAFKKLTSLDLLRAPEAKLVRAGDEPVCVDEACAFAMRVEADMEIGTIWVDAKSGATAWEPNDGRSKRWQIEAYANHDRNRRAAVDTVTDLPEVKSYCAKLRDKHKLRCIVYVDEAPEERASCDASLGLLNPCLFSVYVGELHPTHASRHGTFFVDLDAKQVVAVSPMACDRMSLADWRSYEARRAKRPTLPCPNQKP